MELPSPTDPGLDSVPLRLAGELLKFRALPFAEAVLGNSSSEFSSSTGLRWCCWYGLLGTAGPCLSELLVFRVSGIGPSVESVSGICARLLLFMARSEVTAASIEGTVTPVGTASLNGELFPGLAIENWQPAL